MAKYQDAIDWLAGHWFDENTDHHGDINPNADIMLLVSNLFKKPVTQIEKDMRQEVWEQDNVNRGNG